MYGLSSSYLLCALAGLLVTVHKGFVCSQSEAYMELKGNRLNSSSVVILTDIGEQLSGTQEPDTVRGDALVCVTNYTDCCRGADGSPGGVGRWFFPDDVEVPGIGGEVQHNGIYRNRGTGLVRLNRQANSPLEVDGQYCCEIPVSPTNMERLCVTIVLSDDTPTSSTTELTGPTTFTDSQSATTTSETTQSGLLTTQSSTSLLTTGFVTTEPSTSSTTSSTTPTALTTTESPPEVLPNCNSCLTTNNTLLGLVIFLSFVVVALIFALITALCYIFRTLRSYSSTVRMKNNLEIVQYRQKERKEVSSKAREDDLHVSVKKNLVSYTEVNRPEVDAIPVYEDVLDLNSHGAATIQNKGFRQESSVDLTEPSAGQNDLTLSASYAYPNILIGNASDFLDPNSHGAATIQNKGFEQKSSEDLTKRSAGQNDLTLSATYEYPEVAVVNVDSTSGSDQLQVEND